MAMIPFQWVGKPDDDDQAIIDGETIPSTANIQSLPDELLFEILARVPAQDIHGAIGLVCRKWFHTIHTHAFFREHLKHASCILLFSYGVRTYPDYCLMGAIGPSVEILDFRRRHMLQIVSCCNGLWLEGDGKGNLHVSNPMIRKTIRLPRFTHHFHFSGWILSLYSYGLGYAPASKEYKAVIKSVVVEEPVVETWHVLTIGIDSCWRVVESRIRPHWIGNCSRGEPAIITEGFMHWYSPEGNRLLTMNVETETITEILDPGQEASFHQSGGAQLSSFRRLNEFSWEILEMSPEKGEWSKIGEFCFEAHRGRFRKGWKGYLKPLGWVKYPQVLAVTDTARQWDSKVFICNLVKMEIVQIELPVPLPCAFNSALLYRNSLEWLREV